MEYRPHDYQTRAIDFILDNPYCACLLDMGLGKSVITLTALSRMLEDAEVSKVLVVAPLKVAETTWSSECEKWDHLRHLKVSKVLGSARQRVKALDAKADIYVVGRDSFVWLVHHYNAKLPFDALVLDELTTFKSPSSQRFKAVRLIRGQFNHIIGLTGTPAPNGYMDLWAQMYCIDGGERLGKFITHYRRDNFDVFTAPQGYVMKATLKRGAKERIDANISDICIAMKAEDYLTLPERQDIIQQVMLPDAVVKKYKEFEREMVLEASKEEYITAASAAALMGKLSQFCNGAVYTDDKDVEVIHQEKVKALCELVESAGSPVLVFYQYRHDIPRIQEALAGMAKTVKMYEGEAQLKEWNEGKIDVLLAHPASCAYGLNLQQGGHIIVWFGTTWNLELYQQANARLNRQGQKHPVLVYNLICPGTVDERAYAALTGKATSQNALMNALSNMVNEYKNKKR